METNIFFKKLDYQLEQYNKPLLNEANVFNNIKNIIKSFLSENKERIESVLPKVLDYIINKPLNNNYKKTVFTFILLTIISLGFNVAKAAEIYQNKGVYDKVAWSDIKGQKYLNVAGLNAYFNLGEYNMKYMQIQEWYDSITNQLPSYPVSIKATFIVTISKDPSNPTNRNFANDDTQKEKASGGKLLEKRQKAAVKLLAMLKNKLKADNISFEFNVLTKVEDEKVGYFSEIECEGIPVVTSGNLDDDSYYNKSEDQYDNDGNFVRPNLTGSGLNISSLSRNYQFVELLKLGNINSKRFNGDKIDSGDEYSKWIINTRKHIKEFLTRLQKEFPDKGIQFDKNTKSINPISGSIAGVSNVGKQFQYVQENKYIKCFESFKNENDLTYNKWKKILGQFFPKLTIKQAKSFDSNIDKILNYLEQMYGSSILSFTYAKSIDIKENITDLSIAKEILNQIGNKALFMMGACNFIGDANGVIFKIKGSKKFNYIKITLNSMDLYDISFIKLSIANRTTKDINSIYSDQLNDIISKETGLYLKI
jgi:hypothetical protein